jgi:NAD(P)H-flavin reductase
MKKDPTDKDELLEFKLVKKTQITHDTYIYTFEIPDDLTLGLNVGQHLAIV